MFIVIPNRTKGLSPGVVNVNDVVAAYVKHPSGMDSYTAVLLRGLQEHMATSISPLELLNLIKEAQTSAAIDYILKDDDIYKVKS